MFEMDRHNGMFFTIWYGVYDLSTRTLRFGCGGHHPAWMLPADRSAVTALKTPGLMIGATPDATYRDASVTVPPGGSLYLFSDGVFEILTKDQRQWRLADLLPVVLASPEEGILESQRLHQAVMAVAQSGPLDDDFSLVVVTFP